MVSLDTITLQPRLWPSPSATSTSSIITRTANATSPNPTIANYATALNGVDQVTNNKLKIALWWSLGVLAMLILVIRIGQRISAHLRHMQAMSKSGEQQKYWAMHQTSFFWKFKKHMLYAPIVNRRHNKEFNLFSLNMGTLPTRFHLILLVLYGLSNLGYCLALHYSQKNHYALFAELRGRSGVLGVVNMIALVIFAGRNNPLIQLLQISFDTYNLLHRWIGRIVVAEIIVHTGCWAYVKHTATGFAGMWSAMKDDPFVGWGTVGTVAFTLIMVLSVSPFRHAFYETFLNVHIILVFIAIMCTWIHCDVAHLPQLPYVKAIVCLWSADRVARLIRLFWYNHSSSGWTNATVEALPSKACKVTFHLPTRCHIKPGSHAYLRFASIKPWESHPFSIAWVKDRHSTLPITEKGIQLHSLPFSPNQIHTVDDPNATTDVSFIIQAQKGFTHTLFERASAVYPRQLSLRAAFEGPYGGHHSLDSYGHVVLFAGASGITHQIPYVEHLVHGFSQSTIATRKILLVWIVRDQECLQWVQPWMDSILRMKGRRECLRIKVFITRPKRPEEVVSASRTVQMFPGRPTPDLLLREEVRGQVGAMAVTVCGAGSLADGVRESVRKVQGVGVVDFIEESFTW